MSTETAPSLDAVLDQPHNQSSQELQERKEEERSDLEASTSAVATTAATASSSTSTSAAPQDTTSASQSSQIPAVPSLKRKYTDLMEDLVSQAKASKNDEGKRIVVKDEGADEDDERFGKKLATELTCAICSEIFINPVTCLDCLHVFCGNCLMAWTENDNSTCPSCRKKIRSTRDSFHLKPIIELLFEAKPGMKRDDYDEELKAGPYKPGKAIKIPENYDDESEEEEYESEEEEDADPPYSWEPCPCCPPNNSNTEYTCGNPIRFNDDGNPIRNFALTFQGHKRCAWCDKAVPSDDNSDVLKKTKCAGCQKIYCGSLFGSCPGSPNETLLVKIEDSTIYFPNHFRNHLPPLQSHVNAFEEQRFKDWVNGDSSNLTFEQLGIKMRDWLMNKNNSQLPVGWNMASGDSYACKYCLAETYSGNLREYLIEKREELGYTDNRVKCWYGYACRTQKHNNDHCERIQHLCNEIPPNERRNNAPARSPTVTTGSARNIPRIVPQVNQGTDSLATPSPPGSPSATAAVAAANASSPRQVSGADDGDGGRNSD